MLALREQAAYRCNSENFGATSAGAVAPPSPELVSRRNDNAPLLALAGGALARRFRSWRGRSGKRHIFSVYDAQSCPAYSDAVIIVAAPLDDGGRSILFIGDTGCFPDIVLAKAAADAEGGAEFHVHLLATSPQDRCALIADISQARRS